MRTTFCFGTLRKALLRLKFLFLLVILARFSACRRLRQSGKRFWDRHLDLQGAHGYTVSRGFADAAGALPAAARVFSGHWRLCLGWMPAARARSRFQSASRRGQSWVPSSFGVACSMREPGADSVFRIPHALGVTVAAGRWLPQGIGAAAVVLVVRRGPLCRRASLGLHVGALLASFEGSAGSPGLQRNLGTRSRHIALGGRFREFLGSSGWGSMVDQAWSSSHSARETQCSRLGGPRKFRENAGSYAVRPR